MGSVSARRPDNLTRVRGDTSEDRDTSERQRQQRDGIDRRADRAATAHLEVQVGSARIPRAPHRAEHLPTNDGASHDEPLGEVVEVVVAVCVAARRLQHPGVALVTGQNLLSDEHTINARHHRVTRLTVSTPDVDALMWARPEESAIAEVVEQHEIARKLHREPDLAHQAQPDRRVKRNRGCVQSGGGADRTSRSASGAQPHCSGSDERSS